MTAVFATQDEFSIQATGKTCSVPSDNLAILMYYLNCCNSCLDYVLESKYTNYKEYYNTTDEDKAVIITLAIALNPTELVGKIFFPVEDGSPLLRSSSNEFYKIENAQKLFGGIVDDDAVVMIEGERKKVKKIMVVSKKWLKENYINPLKAIADSFNQPEVSASNYRTYTPRTTTSNYNRNYNNRYTPKITTPKTTPTTTYNGNRNYSKTPLLNDKHTSKSRKCCSVDGCRRSCCSVCGCCRIFFICVSVLFLLLALVLPWYNYIIYDTPNQIDAEFIHVLYKIQYSNVNNNSNSDFSFWGLSNGNNNDQNFHIVFCVTWIAIVIAIVFIIPAISGKKRFFTCVIILIPIALLCGCLFSILAIPKTTPGCTQILANLDERNICNSAVEDRKIFTGVPQFPFYLYFSLLYS